MDKFAVGYMLRKKLFEYPSAGFIITIASGKYKHKERPYRQLPGSTRRFIKQRTFEIKLCSNDKTLEVATCRKEAMARARVLIQEYKEDLYCVQNYRYMHPSFILEYVPSKNAKPGQYVVYGVEECDAAIYNFRDRIY